MKHHLFLAILLLASGCLYAQNTRYETDSTCGCDILFVDGIQTTRDGDRYGFRRDDGTVIAPNIYLHVGTFSNGYCRVWLEDTLCGLISVNGDIVVPCIYHALELPSCGRVLVKKDGKYGFADLNGNVVVPPSYPFASDFSENRAVVALLVDSFFIQYSFIDTTGKVLFSPVYQDARPFSGGFAPVKQYERWGIIDTLGNEVLPTIYEAITIPDHGTFFAGSEEGMSFFNTNTFGESFGKKVLKPLTPPVYFPVTAFSDNRIGVSRNNFQGFLSPDGREVIPCSYDEVGLFHFGRTSVRVGDRYGIIDTLDSIVLPIQYTNNSTKGNKYVYHDSLALVERDGLLGYVDLNGNEVIPLRFQQAYQFSQGLAPVLFNGGWGYIDTHGDIYLPFIFDIASPFLWGRAEVYFQGRKYNIDLKGRCVGNCNGIIAFR